VESGGDSGSESIGTGEENTTGGTTGESENNDNSQGNSGGLGDISETLPEA
jgi:hypothetical protein